LYVNKKVMKMTRVCAELGEELHKTVRKKAIDEGIPMKELIVRVLKKDVELAREKGGRGKGRNENKRDRDSV